MELTVDMGAGQSEVKVGDLAINRLAMHVGAGQVIADLTGNWKDDLDATIQGGVGHAVILLPEDVGVRVHATGGIGSINADKLQRNGSEYTNELYDKSPVNLRLEISGGIGNIELRPVSKGKNSCWLLASSYWLLADRIWRAEGTVFFSPLPIRSRNLFVSPRPMALFKQTRDFIEPLTDEFRGEAIFVGHQNQLY